MLLRLSLLALLAVLGQGTLHVLHTNDIHGRISEFDSGGSICLQAANQTCVGGFARAQTVISQIREEKGADNVLLLGAGDIFQGTPWFDYYKGKASVKFMNMLNYDVFTFGNHEWDNGLQPVRDFLQAATFKVVACNLDASAEPLLQGEDKKPLFQPYHIMDRGGIKLAVIGYMTTETYLYPNIGENIKILDIVQSVQKYIDELKSMNVTSIILLSHAGEEMDEIVARQVQGADLIVGGHTNTFMFNGNIPKDFAAFVPKAGPYSAYPFKAGTPDRPVYIAQDYMYGHLLGHLTVDWADGTITNITGDPHILWQNVTQDANVLAEITNMSKPLIEIYTRNVGMTLSPIEGDRKYCYTHECSMGNLMSDANVWAINQALQEDFLADLKNGKTPNPTRIGFQNSGGIRSGARAGSIKYATVVTVSPFSDSVWRCVVNGSQIRKVITDAIESGVFHHSSGTLITINETNNTKYDGTVGYNHSNPFATVVSIKVLCDAQPSSYSDNLADRLDCADRRHYVDLNDTLKYSIALTTFFLTTWFGGPDMCSESMDTAVPQNNHLARYITAQSPLLYRQDDRILYYRPPVTTPCPEPTAAPSCPVCPSTAAPECPVCPSTAAPSCPVCPSTAAPECPVCPKCTDNPTVKPTDVLKVNPGTRNTFAFHPVHLLGLLPGLALVAAMLH